MSDRPNLTADERRLMRLLDDLVRKASTAGLLIGDLETDKQAVLDHYRRGMKAGKIWAWKTKA